MKTYNVSNATEYAALQEEMTDWIEADCWAVCVNGEFLFNSYIKEKTLCEKLLDKCIRTELRNNVHSALLCELNRSKKHAEITIFMFHDMSKTVLVRYDPDANTYTVSAWDKSED